MLKKVLAGVLLAGVTGILIFGAVQRTNARVGEESSRASVEGARMGNDTALEGRGGQGGGRPEWAGDVAEEPLEEAGSLAAQPEARGGQGWGRSEWPAGGQAVEAGEHPLAQAGAFEAQPGALDEVEAAGLLFMREEEKLARDVYLALYETWGLPVFQNIAASEQAHMDAVLEQMTRYGLADPAADAAQGQFTNPDLQALYDQLVEQGRRSLAGALKVGAAIEEIDILDLDERMAQTDEAGIQAVYQNLARGSENHLRSFTRTLAQQTGGVYQPQYMDQATYQAIISASNGNGGNGRGGNGGGRGVRP